MPPRSLERSRTDLADFLRQRRERLLPADLGLPPGKRRRTPGLRREEVAVLAGVGLTWYTWLEQGRDIGVSEDFLLRLAKVLKLDDADCGHLFMLAHGRPPRAEAYRWPGIRPRVQQLMDEMADRPSCVLNLRWDIIAWNDEADRLFGLARRDPAGRNMLRMTFADPEFRRRLPSWHDEAPGLVEALRRDFALVAEDAGMREFVDDLARVSPDFRKWWGKAQDCPACRGPATILDNGRERRFDQEVLIVDEYRHLRMVVYFETDGTENLTAGRGGPPERPRSGFSG
ncbi:helix-turn-helix transcriptional regulator [Stappia sp. MMSF_3263]|uniref:helix-turn-helix transcriptional regulator n=1 Tax=Stappia sp. MMSF_3263 TaxID=3046693 RepID=UPI00273DE79C|nr:helix-turn-helix transcriptional regulator [Stappia sp. MMSF_3263]